MKDKGKGLKVIPSTKIDYQITKYIIQLKTGIFPKYLKSTLPKALKKSIHITVQIS